jgi:N-acetylglutamate synthase-like GNAT family acetyltransferase
MNIIIKEFNDLNTIKKYRKLRWKAFRKSSNLPLGSEYYKGEEYGIYIGAFLDTNFIGGVFMIDRGNNNAQMHQIVVEKKFRQNGIGSLLLEELEQIAKHQGIKNIYAHARAFLKDFYFNKGYKLIDNKKNVPPNFSTQQQPGIPHVFMKKTLKK